MADPDTRWRQRFQNFNRNRSSRAKGSHKPGSDIDLTLFGHSLDGRLLARLDEAFDDLMLPYRIDLSIFARLRNGDLIDHIRRVGRVLYEKQPAGIAG